MIGQAMAGAFLVTVGYLVGRFGGGYHRHRWGKWARYGLNYQERECQVCGLCQIRGSAA